MKPSPPAIVAAFFVCWSSTGAFAQAQDDILDALEQAAFCLGALTETQQFAQTDQALGLPACDNGRWQRDGDTSIDACRARARRAVDVTLTQTQRKYARYLANHALDSSNPQVAIMMAMGKSAVRASREKDNGLQARCTLECGAVQTPASQNTDCLVPC